MTLCIAALSRKAPKAQIVTVSDLMLSNDYTSIETRVTKVESLSPSQRWLMMFAGSPTPIASIKLGVKERLQNCQETEMEVRAAVEEIYREQLKHKIENEILSPFGIDRETFVRRGRGWFGDQQFNRLVYEIENCRLGVDLIIAGFEPNGWPRIFSVSDPGTYESHERGGFHAIGTGSMRALGSLYTTFDPNLSKSELIYRACEAKFLGESASGVGKTTYVVTLANAAEYEQITPSDVQQHIRPIWEQKGKPPVPPEVLPEIDKVLNKIKWQS
jgi:hypothetical protein